MKFSIVATFYSDKSRLRSLGQKRSGNSLALFLPRFKSYKYVNLSFSVKILISSILFSYAFKVIRYGIFLRIDISLTAFYEISIYFKCG